MEACLFGFGLQIGEKEYPLRTGNYSLPKKGLGDRIYAISIILEFLGENIF